MLGVCVTPWQPYGQEWSVGFLWGCLDWISRLDILVLAALLAYVIIVVGRSSYHCRQAPCESRTHVAALTADLSRRVRTLQSISYAAPYLGLAGTCFGILDSFRPVGMQRDAAIAMLTTYIAASFLTTVAGLPVALAAAGSSNYLLWLIERVELVDPHWRGLAKDSAAGCRVFPKHPLRKQFSKLPAFALIAAPGLAAVLAVFMTFSSFRRSVGLEVRLLQIGAIETNNDSRVQPLLVGLSATSPDEKPDIYLNSKKTTWDDLDVSLLNNLKTRSQRSVYIEADDDVRWAYVALLIDSVKAHSNDVVVLTVAPHLNSDHARRSARSRK
jgi:biopolymer transport protein ExbD